MRHTLFIMIGLFLFPICFAQKAHQQKLLAYAQEYERLGEFKNAIKYYERLFSESKEEKWLVQILYIYEELHDYKAVNNICLQLIKDFKRKDFYDNLAINFLRQKKVNTARKYFEKYRGYFPEDSTIVIYLASCDSIEKWQGFNSSYSVRNLKSINTSFSEFAAVTYDKGVVFTSDRVSSVIIKEKYGKTNTPFFDIYYAQKGNAGYKKAQPFSSELNSVHHDAITFFSRTGDTVYFSRSEHTRKKNIYGQEVNRPKLYMSEKSNNSWSTPKRFILNNEDASCNYPFITPDGKMFFFSSDMPGGYGGMDIYLCLKVDSLWSEPINLGPTINTVGNDIYPFFSTEGELFFSSDTHLGWGGYDVFKSSFKDGDWQEVQNLKYPINTPSNDYAFFYDEEKGEGFISSDRPQGAGSDDVYRVVKKD